MRSLKGLERTCFNVPTGTGSFKMTLVISHQGSRVKCNLHSRALVVRGRTDALQMGAAASPSDKSVAAALCTELSRSGLQEGSVCERGCLTAEELGHVLWLPTRSVLPPLYYAASSSSPKSHPCSEGFGLGQASGEVWLRRAKGLILPTFMGRSLGS